MSYTYTMEDGHWMASCVPTRRLVCTIQFRSSYLLSLIGHSWWHVLTVSNHYHLILIMLKLKRGFWNLLYVHWHSMYVFFFSFLESLYLIFFSQMCTYLPTQLRPWLRMFIRTLCVKDDPQNYTVKFLYGLPHVRKIHAKAE